MYKHGITGERRDSIRPEFCLFLRGMPLLCPYCDKTSDSERTHPRIVRIGNFTRRSDSRIVQRYLCRACGKSFSRATFSDCYRQNKRQFNELIRRLLSSSVSQRRIAKILKLNRKTVVRKFLFLAMKSRSQLSEYNKGMPLSSVIEFDDLETFEHTKCKPLSVTMAVEFKSRRILGFEVSRMPAKGKLAVISRRKYGPRPDERSDGRKKLFKDIQSLVLPSCEIKSDESPHYLQDVRSFFPTSFHRRFKGKRGCIVGQGELKKVGFDPLFSLNHTYAKLRADINRLARRTWCTTKDPERLADHIAIFANYHNLSLK